MVDNQAAVDDVPDKLFRRFKDIVMQGKRDQGSRCLSKHSLENNDLWSRRFYHLLLETIQYWGRFNASCGQNASMPTKFNLFFGELLEEGIKFPTELKYLDWPDHIPEDDRLIMGLPTNHRSPANNFTRNHVQIDLEVKEARKDLARHVFLHAMDSSELGPIVTAYDAKRKTVDSGHVEAKMAADFIDNWQGKDLEDLRCLMADIYSKHLGIDVYEDGLESDEDNANDDEDERLQQEQRRREEAEREERLRQELENKKKKEEERQRKAKEEREKERLRKEQEERRLRDEKAKEEEKKKSRKSSKSVRFKDETGQPYNLGESAIEANRLNEQLMFDFESDHDLSQFKSDNLKNAARRLNEDEFEYSAQTSQILNPLPMAKETSTATFYPDASRIESSKLKLDRLQRHLTSELREADIFESTEKTTSMELLAKIRESARTAGLTAADFKKTDQQASERNEAIISLISRTKVDMRSAAQDKFSTETNMEEINEVKYLRHAKLDLEKKIGDLKKSKDALRLQDYESSKKEIEDNKNDIVRLEILNDRKRIQLEQAKDFLSKLRDDYHRNLSTSPAKISFARMNKPDLLFNVAGDKRGGFQYEESSANKDLAHHLMSEINFGSLLGTGQTVSPLPSDPQAPNLLLDDNPFLEIALKGDQTSKLTQKKRLPNAERREEQTDFESQLAAVFFVN